MVETKPNLAVPFNDLVAQYEQIRPDIDAAIQRVIQSSAFIGGDEVTCFEKEFAEYCGAADCAGVANGTDAIELALTALGIGQGDEVILPAMTFVGTVEPVLAIGAIPIIVDIDPATYTMSPQAVEAAITPRTRCILTVHLYGLISDMTSFRQLADDHGLFLVEDAAQSHGARCDGQRSGSTGDIATFSFFPGKNLGAYGDGGAVVSQDTALIERIRSLRNHGRSPGEKFLHGAVGRNSRLDNLQAAILRVKLLQLDKWNNARRVIAEKYRVGLANRFKVPYVPPGYEHVFHIYCLRIAERDEVATWLKENGIASGLHYPLPVHQQPGLIDVISQRPLRCAVAEDLAETCLSLPIFPEMSDAQVEAVINALQKMPQFEIAERP